MASRQGVQQHQSWKRHIKQKMLKPEKIGPPLPPPKTAITKKIIH